MFLEEHCADFNRNVHKSVEKQG